MSSTYKATPSLWNAKEKLDINGGKVILSVVHDHNNGHILLWFLEKQENMFHN